MLQTYVAKVGSHSTAVKLRCEDKVRPSTEQCPLQNQDSLATEETVRTGFLWLVYLKELLALKKNCWCRLRSQLMGRQLVGQEPNAKQQPQIQTRCLEPPSFEVLLPKQKPFMLFMLFMNWEARPHSQAEQNPVRKI